MRVVPWSNGVDHGQQNTLHPLWVCPFVTRRNLCVTQAGCYASPACPLRKHLGMPLP